MMLPPDVINRISFTFSLDLFFTLTFVTVLLYEHVMNK